VSIAVPKPAPPDPIAAPTAPWSNEKRSTTW
jgi:hypothetical protein